MFEDFPDDEIFAAEETKALTEVTRADFLDLANVLGSADEITGLARFESNRLAIFTNDQTIVFKVDPITHSVRLTTEPMSSSELYHIMGLKSDLMSFSAPGTVYTH